MSDAPTDALPFVAPCRRLPALAPLRWMLLVLLSSFIFVAPVLAIGLYAISAQLERGDTPRSAVAWST
jgi:uncharacterized membrane protein